MPTLNAFHGIRYAAPDQLKDLVCPPYDVISPEEQAALYARHPHNAVRVELPFSEHPEEPKEERYKRADYHFREWLRSGILTQDESPCLYIYRQDFVTSSGDRRQVTGVIGALHLEEFGQESGILPHERTMPGPIEDRLALLRACPVNISPIYGIYGGGGELMPYLESLQQRPTQGRLADDHGNLHRLWVISAPGEIEMLTGGIGEGPLVIADGHHRYETALAYYREQHISGHHEAVMCFCVDADAEDLEVLPYHRAFLTDLSSDALQASLEKDFSCTTYGPGEGPPALRDSKADHALLFVLADRDVLVELDDEMVRAEVGDRAPAWRDLDVVALHEVVLHRIEPEGLENLIFSNDASEVMDLVRKRGWTAGVLLKPLRAAEVIEVARSGERMPQKASYFWPKAVTGLVFRSLR